MDWDRFETEFRDYVQRFERSAHELGRRQAVGVLCPAVAVEDALLLDTQLLCVEQAGLLETGQPLELVKALVLRLGGAAHVPLAGRRRREPLGG